MAPGISGIPLMSGMSVRVSNYVVGVVSAPIIKIARLWSTDLPYDISHTRNCEGIYKELTSQRRWQVRLRC